MLAWTLRTVLLTLLVAGAVVLAVSPGGLLQHLLDREPSAAANTGRARSNAVPGSSRLTITSPTAQTVSPPAEPGALELVLMRDDYNG